MPLFWMLSVGIDILFYRKTKYVYISEMESFGIQAYLVFSYNMYTFFENTPEQNHLQIV